MNLVNPLNQLAADPKKRKREIKLKILGWYIYNRQTLKENKDLYRVHIAVELRGFNQMVFGNLLMIPGFLPIALEVMYKAFKEDRQDQIGFGDLKSRIQEFNSKVGGTQDMGGWELVGGVTPRDDDPTNIRNVYAAQLGIILNIPEISKATGIAVKDIVDDINKGDLATFKAFLLWERDHGKAPGLHITLGRDLPPKLKTGK